MMKEKTITIVSDRRNIVLKTGTILYVLMNRKYAEFHVLGDHVYKTRMTLAEIEEKLGDGFLKIHRGCLVSAMVVHDIKDRVDLSNGEALEYTVRKKKIILKELQSIQEKMIHEFRSENIPKTKEEYQDYYPASIRCPLPSRISRWYSTIIAVPSTGSSGMGIRRLPGWKSFPLRG